MACVLDIWQGGTNFSLVVPLAISDRFQSLSLEKNVNQYQSKIETDFPHPTRARKLLVQSSPKVWDRIPTIWDIIDLTKNSLKGDVNFTKFDYHENGIVNNTES